MRYAIPPRFATARLPLLDKKFFGPVLEYARNLQENIEEGNGLLLMGQPGVGKTFAVAALTHHYWMQAQKHSNVYKSRDYIFITAPDFFDRISVVGEARDEHRKKDFIESFCTTPLLIVNDLGKEYRGGKLSEQIPMKLGRILRERSQEKLPTFFTTNLNATSLFNTYGEAIMSLLRENTEAYEVGGKDRRVRSKLKLIEGGKKLG